MVNPRDVLNGLKWKKEYCLEKAEIWIVHRGAPHDTKVISGKDIKALGRSFMETTTATIPYHRIFKIFYEDEIVFER